MLGDFLPKDELNKFLPGKAKAPADPSIDKSNVGHKLLQKMGWKEVLSFALSLSPCVFVCKPNVSWCLLCLIAVRFLSVCVCVCVCLLGDGTGQQRRRHR